MTATAVKKPIKMITRGGHRIYFLSPEKTTITETDLFEALRRIGRYGGHANVTDLQHLALCVGLAKLDPEIKAIEGEDRLRIIARCAIHDFHEVYIGDVIIGLKPFLPAYKEIEAKWEAFMTARLGLPPMTAEDQVHVTRIDYRAAFVEMTYCKHPAASYQGSLRKAPPITEAEGKLAAYILDPHVGHLNLWTTVMDALEAGGGHL